MSVIDLGDDFTLSYDHYVNGSLADATSATWTVTLPDGTTSSQSATASSTGLYRDTYTPTQAGRHLWRWVGTGSNPGAQTGTFTVRPATPSDLISLAEAKEQLNVTGTTYDDEIRVFIEAATKAAEDHRDEVIARRSVTVYRDVSVADRFVLPRVPVISLTSVATIDALTSWDVSNLHVDPARGVVTVKSGPLLDGPLAITYVAGYSVVPPAFSLAVRIIVQHLWETQRGKTGATRFAGSIDDANLLRFRSIDVFVPPRAQELLGNRAPLVA